MTAYQRSPFFATYPFMTVLLPGCRRSEPGRRIGRRPQQPETEADQPLRRFRWLRLGRTHAKQSPMDRDRLMSLITRRSRVQILPPLRREPLGHPHILRAFSRSGVGRFRCSTRRSTGVRAATGVGGGDYRCWTPHRRSTMKLSCELADPATVPSTVAFNVADRRPAAEDIAA